MVHRDPTLTGVAARFRAALPGAAALVLALSACTASQPGTGHPGPAVVSAAAQHPAALVAEAEQGLNEVLAYRAKGTLVLLGQKVTVDLAVEYAGGHGTIAANGVEAVLDYVRLNPPPGASGLYITAPLKYWENIGQSPAEAARYAGKQVSVPATSALANGVLLLRQESLTQSVFAAAGALSSAHVLASPPVDGQPAWIVDFGGDHTTRLTTMQNGQQFPLRLVSPHATLSFGEFGTEPHIVTPTGVPLSLPG